MTGLTQQPLYCSMMVIDGTFFLNIPATFCRPYRLSFWFLLKSLEPRLNLMWPQWHSELWDMRQCPGPVTTTANQRCSQICPTCCGPEWLTPLGTTCARSIRRERPLWQKQWLGHWFDRSFFSFILSNLSQIFQRCWRQWRHQDKH